MGYAKTALQAIRGHLAEHRQQAANILIGPKNERWFNSEAFVAVNSVANLNAKDTVVFYGEEAYRTIMKEKFKKVEESEDKPDLVGYRFRLRAKDDIALILEAKLVYAREKNIKVQLTKLVKQLTMAKKIVRGAEVLGVIYACVLATDKKYVVRPDYFFDNVVNTVEKIVGDKWIISSKISMIDGFRNVNTTMPYPHTAITLGVGGIVI